MYYNIKIMKYFWANRSTKFYHRQLILRNTSRYMNQIYLLYRSNFVENGVDQKCIYELLSHCIY